GGAGWLNGGPGGGSLSNGCYAGGAGQTQWTRDGSTGAGGGGSIGANATNDLAASSTFRVGSGGGGGGGGAEEGGCGDGETGGAGGSGGLGRVRLSVTPAGSAVSGSFNPPLGNGANAFNQPCFSYVAAWPN